MFDDAVKSILDESKAVEESIIAYKPAHTQAEQSVIRFLDIYFKGVHSSSLFHC